MHVNTKKMAFSGLALALTVIAIVLSGVLEINTLFLLAAAAFIVGVIIRECGLRFGSAFYLAAVLLGVMLAPNKLYCLTFGALALYILALEWAHYLLGKISTTLNRNILFWVLKFLIFNLIYLPVLFLLPELLFPGGIATQYLPVLIAAGQVALLIYTKAYDYFQIYVWGNFRKRLGF